MSEPQRFETAPRPVTTKVGGGLSPRLAAGIAAALLGAVVWIGVTGRAVPVDSSLATRRPATSASLGTSPTAAAAVSTPTPSPTRAIFLTPPPESLEPGLAGVTFGRDKYGVMANVDGRFYLEVLEEFEPGRFRGSFRVPFPSDSTNRYEIKLAQLWSRENRRGSYVEIGTWPMFLVPLREATQDSGPVLQAGFAGKPDQRGVPRAVQRGFNLVVRAESRVTYGVVRVEIDFSRRLAL